MIKLDSKRELDVDLNGEKIRLKVITLHKNGKEGVGVMLQDSMDPHMRDRMELQWGAFVQFAQFGEEKLPRLVRKIFELVGEDEWVLL